MAPAPAKPLLSRPLEFGWFLPTAGDTRAFGDPEGSGAADSASEEFPSGIHHFERVTRDAEEAGFEYLLVPVQTLCWEAWVTSALIVGRSKKIKPLVAARPGYIQPALLAKMISTFDQLTGGRICINLIAGASDKEARADGITLSKDERYSVMFEEEILKRLWAARGNKIDFVGEHYQLEGARCHPPTHQDPHPPFYLGGGSQTAWRMSARHADVHLFWGDTPASIAGQITQIRELAAQEGRADQLGFGMRLQIVCRDTEEQAWQAAAKIIEGASDNWQRMIKGLWSSSAANTRMKQIAEQAAANEDKIAPHLWTGLTKIRPGAGVAVVGDPQQVAATLQEFVDVGCHSFCLSGYPHHEEAVRFGECVMPLLVD
jgi:alkanesulfonate monooxygenase